METHLFEPKLNLQIRFQNVKKVLLLLMKSYESDHSKKKPFETLRKKVLFSIVCSQKRSMTQETHSFVTYDLFQNIIMRFKM